jgi:hypothetical protein
VSIFVPGDAILTLLPKLPPSARQMTRRMMASACRDRPHTDRKRGDFSEGLGGTKVGRALQFVGRIRFNQKRCIPGLRDRHLTRLDCTDVPIDGFQVR